MMKTVVYILLLIIAFAYSSEPEGSSENNDSDFLEQVAGWGPYFHEGKDPCPSNDTFMSHCVSCRCVGDKSADCNKGGSCYIPESPLPVKPPCELGKSFCIGPIHCICHSINSSLATCDGNNYETCVTQ